MQASNLHLAKLEVMKRVGYVQKGRSTGLSYSFAGEAALIEALRPAMIDNGLVMSGPIGEELLADQQYKTARGGDARRVLVKVRYRLTHAPSGEHEEYEAIGEAADTSDKAVGKAETHALKYVLRQGFLIETGDDPDTTPSEHHQPAQQQAAAPPTPPPPPPKPISNEQAIKLLEIMDYHGVDIKRFCDAYHIDEVGQLPESMYADAWKKVRAKYFIYPTAESSVELYPELFAVHDAALVDAGLIKPGELLDFLKATGAEAKQPSDIKLWPKEILKIAAAKAMEFDRQCRKR